MLFLPLISQLLLKGKGRNELLKVLPKRCLNLEFGHCDAGDDVNGVQLKKKEKVGGVN